MITTLGSYHSCVPTYIVLVTYHGSSRDPTNAKTRRYHESQKNPQNDHEWEEERFGIPLPLSDDDSSDEDMEVDSDEGNDDFWKDQKVIVGGRLANPTSEQI